MDGIITSEKVWANSYPNEVDVDFEGDNNTLLDNLFCSIRDYGNNSALVYEDQEMTYNELGKNVKRFASFLSQRGVKKGTQIAISLPNSFEMVIACYSCMAIGAVFILMNPSYKEYELDEIYEKSKIKYLICTSEIAKRTLKINHKAHLDIHNIIIIDDNELTKDLADNENESSIILNFNECLNSGDPNFDFDMPIPNDTVCLQFTGGTTGKIKAAVLTHRNLNFDVAALEHSIYDFVRGQEVVISACPLFHIYGFTVSMNYAIRTASKNILVSKAYPQKIIQILNGYNITLAALVPAHYIGMLEYTDLLEKSDLVNVRFLSGGAGAPIEVLDKFERITGKPILEGYGLTEASPVTHLNPYNGKVKFGSIGIPFPGVWAAIKSIGKNSKFLPSGERGELVIKGPNVFSGYYNTDDGYEANKTSEWLHTGDLAYMDDDGYFYIVDRIKDIIITSAFNVSPRELEEFFYHHPKVYKVAVIGVPDKKKGEAIVVFVVLKEGETATESELLQYCKEGLSKYKLPKDIVITERLPENQAGKILKYVLKENYTNKK